MKKIFLLGLIATLLGCGGGSSSNDAPGPVLPKVINGSEVSLDISPQFTAINITYSDGTSGFCSGTVIDGDSILTAGHCLRGPITGISLAGALGTIESASYLAHPGYFEDFNVGAIFNDVGIIKTKSPHGLPALPVLASVASYADEPFSVYGFGLDENQNYGILKSGAAQIQIATPNHLFGPVFTGGNVNPCDGDSGGAAIVFVTLPGGEFTAGIVGTVSSGTVEGCAPGDMTYYTNIQNPGILSFILENAPGTVLK